MDFHHCILCGTHDPEAILSPTRDLTTLITERAIPGPVAFPAVMSWSGTIIPTCRQCLHQLRRHRFNAKNRQMLPLDTSILQTVVPGIMRQQDTRTTARMLKGLMDPGNRYYRVFEALDHLLQGGLPTWWEYNLHTQFYAHKPTARLMRLSGLLTLGTGSTSSTP